MNDILNAFNTLNGLPGLVLVALLCIALGYVLRLIPKFPNGAIPLTCWVLGGVLNVLLADAAPTNVLYRVWFARQLIVGMLCGFCAWMFHKAVLKEFEDKIPLLGKLLAALPNGDIPYPSGPTPVPYPVAPPSPAPAPAPVPVPTVTESPAPPTAKLPLVIGFLLLGASLVVGCMDFSTTVFRLERTAAMAGTNGVHAFNAYYQASSNKVSLEVAKTNVYDASRKMGASLFVLESSRQAYATNGATQSQVQAALDTLVSQSSNLVWLVNYFTH